VRLSQIRDFLAVVEAGSIRAAARKLGVTQPTITKSVRSLEDDLGVSLLNRTTRGIALTALGRQFFARANVAQSELRKAEEEMSRRGGYDGSVSFGVGPAGALLYLPEAVASFRKQFPKAQLRIIEGIASELLPAVRNEKLDFVVGLRPVSDVDANLRFRPLYRTQLVVAARKGHPLRAVRSLVQLQSADWLTTPTLGLPGGPLQRTFASHGLPLPRQVIQCESYNTVVALVAQSDILALMQRRLLHEGFARDVLQEIAISETLPTVTAGMFTRADTPLTRLASIMAKAVVNAARKLAAG
jgi:LysR family transcriptional regulator, regulator of abg operon